MNQGSIKEVQYDAPKSAPKLTSISSAATSDGSRMVNSTDDNRFEALFENQNNNDRSGKFSLTRYSTYTRNQHLRKLNLQKGFKSVVNKLMNKQNWKQRWSELKSFVRSKQGLNESSLKHQTSLQLASGKTDIFNIILALYAGEDQEQVFRQLNVMADRYPAEVEFYVPQLCTYLFHFSAESEQRESFVLLENPKPEGPGFQPDEEKKTETFDTTQGSHRNLLKEFIIDRSRRSIKIAHLVFWYLVANFDDSESIQMSQHKNKELWAFLETLLVTCEESLEGEAGNQTQPDVVQTDHWNQLQRFYETSSLLSKKPNLSLRKDQQVMRTLSSNMTNFSQFLSTPKLVSDLLFVSDLLKNVEKEERNYYLIEILKEINKNLPANVYIPIKSQNLKFKSTKKSKKSKRQANTSSRLHRVLAISTDYAFCLHSKERVPYHIIIQVALLDKPAKRKTSNSQDEQDFSRSFEDDSSDSSGQYLAPGFLNNTDPERDRLTSEFAAGTSIEMIERVSTVSTNQRLLISPHKENLLGANDSPVENETGFSNQNKHYKLDTYPATPSSSNTVKQFLHDFKEIEIEGDRTLEHHILSPAKKQQKAIPSKKMQLDSMKVYLSDIEETKKKVNTSSSDGGYFNADSDSISDDDNDQQAPHSLQLTTCCDCFGFTKKRNAALTSETKSDTLSLSKPQGLFGQKSFNEVCLEIAEKSSFGGLKNKQSFGLISCIVKSGDDLKQEQFASQMISKFKDIFVQHGLKLWLKPFNIIATCADGGLIQTVPDSISIDKLKKSCPQFVTLKQYFKATYKQGIKGTNDQESTKKLSQKVVKGIKQLNPQQQFQARQSRKRYAKARNAFLQSMAGYSLLCYILQIKDRHNGNILLDSKGHMIHVDFGFLLSNSPGNINGEASSFKMTSQVFTFSANCMLPRREYVELLGGQNSRSFTKFQGLMVKGFLTLREHAEELISFVEMTMLSGIDLPCFQGKDRVVSALRDRFKLDMSPAECKTFMLDLIQTATDNWRTNWYDKYQRYTVGIW